MVEPDHTWYVVELYHRVPDWGFLQVRAWRADRLRFFCAWFGDATFSILLNS